MIVATSLVASLFSLDTVYVLTGLLLLTFGGMTLVDRNHPQPIGTALFWSVLGVIFMLGSVIPAWATGLLVLCLVALDGAGCVGVSSSSPRSGVTATGAVSFDPRIFIPVLIIPCVTVLFAGLFYLVNDDDKGGAPIGFGFGGVVAMIAVLRVTRGSARDLLEQGRRLNETMGAVNILPQLLASLGMILKAAAVGDVMAHGIRQIVPPDSLFLLVLANCAGMALLTMIMGNSFAAFPVIASGILAPLILEPFHANPALVAIMTLTAGASGTLVTPMAANFNTVPVALLGMRDAYGVIKFQWPLALTIWSFHVVCMWWLIR